MVMAKKATEEKSETAAAPAAEEKRAPADKPKARAARKEKSTAAPDGSGRKRKRGRSMRSLAKRQRQNLKVKPEAPVPLDEAIKCVRQMAQGRKFDQTVDVVMHLGIDPRQADQMIRGAISLPHGIGKARRVICFAEGEEAEKAREAGAVEVGADDLIKKVTEGWMDFDVAIAHPRLMGKVGKLGRVLGPAGKMPSPKNGTVNADVEQAVREFAAGKVEFRNDAGGNVHGVVGKMNFDDATLSANIEAFIEHIRRMRPQTAKGQFIRKVCVKATMTPAVEIKVAQ
jgi:large subunit ribosomal protein L1